MADPTVAVIVPVHNAAPFLREAVMSVLNQTYCGKIEVSPQWRRWCAW
jgi:glycosyltransferase involved in cell wall biosynthesis